MMHIHHHARFKQFIKQYLAFAEHQGADAPTVVHDFSHGDKLDFSAVEKATGQTLTFDGYQDGGGDPGPAWELGVSPVAGHSGHVTDLFML